MLTLDQIFEHLEYNIAQATLSGDTVALHQLQTVAGFLMSAADANHDESSAYRFRVLAAKAANRREEIDAAND